MIIHTAQSRGLADHGWLQSRHTFSFAGYHNPERMGFGALRVINDDSVEAGQGFGTHSHRDMEIISIPLVGSLQHKDSQGNATVIKKGEVQIMSAGTGIAHSEYNASTTEAVKFLQIWVLPKKLGIKPRYEQKDFPQEERMNKFVTVVSPDGREGSLSINQDAYFSLGDLEADKVLRYQRQGEGTGVYVLVLKGEVEVDGIRLGERDGLGMESFKNLNFRVIAAAEVLLMEVPYP
jgi:redox-sensitive bicupin YhaK (pirin superfamily)